MWTPLNLFANPNPNPFFNDFVIHRWRLGLPHTLASPRFPPNAAIIGDLARNAVTSVLVNAAMSSAFNIIKAVGSDINTLVRGKGTVVDPSSSGTQSTTSVWLRNVIMLAKKLPKKCRGEFLNVLHTNFSNAAIVWIIIKQTADRLVLFMQIVVIIAGGVIIFLYIGHIIDVREKKLTQQSTNLQEEQIPSQKNKKDGEGRELL